MRKLNIFEWYQSLTIQNQKKFYAFHVQRGHNQALGTEGYVAAPPGLKCCKKKIKIEKELKKEFFIKKIKN
jgi:hypothetical protein